MIRRAFPAARVRVDPAAGAPGRELLARENEVDPEAGIAAQRTAPIVPPAERPFRLLEAAEHVHQTERQQRAQAGPFRFADQYGTGPGGR